MGLGALQRFTSAKRQHTLDTLLNALQTDDRIVGVVVVGSAAIGFDDEYSDIDLSVVIAPAVDVRVVFDEWHTRIYQMLPMVAHFETQYGPDNFLHGFLLENFLELDIGFLPLGTLYAKRERWQMAFDRTGGDIPRIMQTTWVERDIPDPSTIYQRNLASIWHYITHVSICLQREHCWRALHYLEHLRNRTVALAALRYDVNASHFREADQLPADFLAALQTTLVTQPDAVVIARGLRAAVTLYFEQARALDERFGVDVAASLERAMDAFIASVGD